MSLYNYRLLNIGGVWPTLYMASGWSANERGSETIEPLDIIMAIYIIDFERVSVFWDNVEGYERFVANIKLGSGEPTGYVNRTLYLIQHVLSLRDNPGTFNRLGRPSEALQRIVFKAQESATARAGKGEAPSSRDLLFSACLEDGELATELQRTGLQLEKLKTAVKGTY